MVLVWKISNEEQKLENAFLAKFSIILRIS